MRRLLLSSTGKGDHLLVLTVKSPAKAVISAYNSIKGLTSRMGVYILPLQEVDPDDIPGSIARLADLVDDIMLRYNLSDIVIDATGGVKLLVLATIILAIILSEKYNIEYHIQSETELEYDIKITSKELQIITQEQTKEDTKLIQAILQNPGKTPTELSEITGIHYKTLLNRLGKLKKQGLAYQKGRGGQIYPTKWTKIIQAKTKLKQTPS